MPPRQPPHTTPVEADSYRSISCRIGTHNACAESSPVTAPVDVPVIYESCECPCHAFVPREMPAEVTR